MLHVHNNRHTYRCSNKWLQVVYALELAREDLPKLSDVYPDAPEARPAQRRLARRPALPQRCGGYPERALHVAARSHGSSSSRKGCADSRSEG